MTEPESGESIRALATRCANTRRALVEFNDTDWGWDFAVNSLQGGLNPNLTMDQRLQLAKAITDNERLGLQRAVLFAADSSMSQLVDQAARSIPPQSLLPTDAIVPEGFVLFSDPIAVTDPDPNATRFSITAIRWSHFGDPKLGSSFIVMTYVHSDNFTETNFNTVVPEHLPWNFVQWPTEQRLPVDGGDLTAVTAIKALATFWTLAQQDLTSTGDEEPGNRTSRKLSARRGIERPDEPVRLISLHVQHREQAQGDETQTISADEKRRYSHQWIVRGFWRNTWFPSLGTHRVQWIAPHRRGPQDKPLLGGDKVIVARGPVPSEE